VRDRPETGLPQPGVWWVLVGAQSLRDRPLAQATLKPANPALGTSSRMRKGQNLDAVWRVG